MVFCYCHSANWNRPKVNNYGHILFKTSNKEGSFLKLSYFKWMALKLHIVILLIGIGQRSINMRPKIHHKINFYSRDQIRESQCFKFLRLNEWFWSYYHSANWNLPEGNKAISSLSSNEGERLMLTNLLFKIRHSTNIEVIK